MREKKKKNTGPNVSRKKIMSNFEYNLWKNLQEAAMSTKTDKRRNNKKTIMKKTNRQRLQKTNGNKGNNPP